MRRLPNDLATKQDIENCVEMAKAGKVKAKDVLKLLKKIRNRNYFMLPVKTISDDRKTVTVNYCAEAAAGGTANAGAVTATIKTVTHNDGEPDAQGNVSKVTTDIVLSKAIAAGTEILEVAKTPSEYDRYDMTETEFLAVVTEVEEMISAAETTTTTE